MVTDAHFRDNHGLMIIGTTPQVLGGNEVLGTCKHCGKLIEGEAALAIDAPAIVAPEDETDIVAYQECVDDYNRRYPNGVVLFHFECVTSILRDIVDAPHPGPVLC